MKKQITDPKSFKDLPKLLTETMKLKQEIEALTLLLHQKNDRQHEIRKILKELGADQYAKSIRVHTEKPWKEMIYEAIRKSERPLRSKEIIEAILEANPIFTREKIKQKLYHVTLVLKNNNELLELRSPNTAGNYYVPPDFNKSKLRGFVLVR